jgi:cellobiose phosphorylase
VLRLDPVIPASLDGLRVKTSLTGRPVEVEYRIADPGCGVSRITLNGTPVPFTRADNPHRTGAALAAISALLALLRADGNVLQVTLGQ